MEILFLVIGLLAAVIFPFVGIGANVGVGLICGLSFIAAAIMRVAHAIEQSAGVKSGANQAGTKPRQAWSMPDKPVGESGKEAVF